MDGYVEKRRKAVALIESWNSAHARSIVVLMATEDEFERAVEDSLVIHLDTRTRERRTLTHAEAHARLKAKGFSEIRLRNLFPAMYGLEARTVERAYTLGFSIEVR
jgi:hypothetical protein